MNNANDDASAPMLRKRRVKRLVRAFKEQRLPASQPSMSAGTFAAIVFLIGILCIPVGVGLLHVSNMVQEHSLNYTNCLTNETTPTGNHKLVPCYDIINRSGHNWSIPCVCNITFQLDTDFVGQVFMYYGLKNFFQSHRRYMKSRDDNQLFGNLDDEPSRACDPYREADGSTPEKKVFILPCGAIANSMFNDTLRLAYEHAPNKYVPIPVFRTGIVPSGYKERFRNPKGTLKTVFEKFAKPKNWQKNLWELDTDDDDNNGLQNEDLIVWMQPAAFPNFRKLYRRIDHSKEGLFKKGLPKGNYILTIEYNYGVTGFNGTKSMFLSTTSFLGGKNPFLGYLYIVVGCMCVVLSIALMIVHIKRGERTDELININRNTPYR